MSRKHSRSVIALIASACSALFAGQALLAADVIPPKTYTLTPSGINLADGSFVYAVTDLSMGSLQLQRFYRGKATQANDPSFGKNFSSNFDIYVAANPGTGGAFPYYPIVHIGQSATGTYVRTGSLVAPNNMDAERGQLNWNGTQYVYINASGTIYTFSATFKATGFPWSSLSQKIERIDFPDGRRQDFSYDSVTGNLKVVDDSSGYAMVFDYNGDGDITTACAFNRSQTYVNVTSDCSAATLKTSYTYDANKYLASATDVLLQVTNYTQSTIYGLTCIKPPGFATCAVSFSGGVQTLLDGGTWTWSGQNPDLINNPELDQGTDGGNDVAITDPNGVQIPLKFTKSSPYELRDANGNVTQFRYTGAQPYSGGWTSTTDGSFLTQAIYPEGNQYLAEYLGPFKSVTKETLVPKPGSGLANLVKTYGYAATCNSPDSYQNCAKPRWVKDPNNNQTDYTYAPHGGVTTEMLPAPSAAAPRPLKVFVYVQKSAYIQNASGSLVPAATPLWVLSTETLCQAASPYSGPTCDGTGAQTVTTYEYGPNSTANNLRVRGVAVSSGPTTLRTCYGYDNQGNKIWETSPRAGLGSCP